MSLLPQLPMEKASFTASIFLTVDTPISAASCLRSASNTDKSRAEADSND
jgi:hypothetical protein